MGAQDYYCEVCEKPANEEHHIVFRSQCQALVNCKLNHSYLCSYHHRNSKVGVHFNKDLDKKLKLRLQNKLELIFDKEYFTRENIRQALKTSESSTDSLCKMIKQKKGVFAREDIIRACMGGKLINQEEVF